MSYRIVRTSYKVIKGHMGTQRGQTYTFDKMAGLTEAKDNYLLGKLKKRIRQTDLLTLDEMSYVGFYLFQSEMACNVVSNPS